MVSDSARTRWLQNRRRGVGGSDVAAILGVSPWRSAWDVWADKTGRLPLDDSDETPAQRRGRLLEQPVADWYAEDTGYAVRQSAVDSIEGDEPWQLASPDRIVQNVGTQWGLECKTARSDFGWGESGQTVTSSTAAEVMPVSYALQVAWYLEVVDYDRWDVAVLIMGTDDLRRYTVTRDRDFGARLVKKIGRWWERHVVQGEAPPIEGTDAAAAWLVNTYPAPKDPLREVEGDEETLLRDLREAEDVYKAAEKAKKDAEARVKQAIGDARGLFCDGLGRVLWTTSKPRELFDKAALKRDHPDIAAKYTKQGEPTRSLRRTWK